MNRQELLNQIEHYTPFNEQEEMDKQLILNWIRNNTNAFSRENTVAHMTASAWVVNQDKTHCMSPEVAGSADSFRAISLRS